MNNLIFLTEFGSTVYGTKIPTSDTDLKAISLPTAEEILLQKMKRTNNTTTKKNERDKNKANDVDTEIFNLQTYCNLLLEGQTVSLDMLFVPSHHWKIQDPIWWNILQNRKEFLHSGTSSFVGYCRTQANKYGIKGSRMNSLRISIEFLETLNKDNNLHQCGNDFIRKMTCEAGEFCNVVYIANKHGKEEPYLEVLGKKFSFFVKVKEILKNLKAIWDNQGERTRLAAQNQGIDWKALMHSVRVAKQAEELLLTSNITFPRPEKNLLLQIRKGELAYNKVAEIIEQGLVDVEAAKNRSILPREPNFQFVNDFVKNVHKEIVCGTL